MYAVPPERSTLWQPTATSATARIDDPRRRRDMGLLVDHAGVADLLELVPLGPDDRRVLGVHELEVQLEVVRAVALVALREAVDATREQVVGAEQALLLLARVDAGALALALAQD